jgi:fibronectin-binding autotransporter adhesin
MRAIVVISLGFMLFFTTNRIYANGTAYYFDVNGATPGFGIPTGTYNFDAALWTTDPAGASPTIVIPAESQLTFGNVASDFDGCTFSILFNSAVGIRWSGLLLNSNNANITITGLHNSYLSGDQTWTIASGSTLNMSASFQGQGLNMNNVNLTLQGGGTINWTTAIGYNSNGTITQDGAGLTVNLHDDGGGTLGTDKQASYTLTQGTLNFATATSAGAFNRMRLADNAKFTINGGTINNTSGSAIVLDIYQGTYSIAGSFSLTGTNNIDFGTYPVALTASPTITVSASTLTIGGTVSGAFNITKAGAGSLTLSGSNTYTGSTTINAGTLKLGASGVIPNASAVTVTSPGILDMNGFSETVGSIAGTGTIDNMAVDDTPVLTFGEDNKVTEFSGVIKNTTGVLSLVKNGTGMLTMSGNNTFSGTCTINNGIFAAKHANSLGTTQGSTTVNNGASLVLYAITYSAEPLIINGNGYVPGLPPIYPGVLRTSIAVTGSCTFSGPITLGSDSQIGTQANNVNLILSGVISGGFNLTKVGTGTTAPGTLTLSGANTYTGATAVNAGVLRLGNTSALGSADNGTTVATDAALDLNGIAYSATEALTINGTGISSGGALTNSSSTAATFGGLITLGSASSIVATSGDILITHAGTITGDTYGLTVGGSHNTSIASIIGTGNGTLTKNGTGTLTLSGDNTYSGITTIGGGILQIGNNTTTGLLPGNAVNNATLRFSRSDTCVYNQTISGIGSIHQNGPGVLRIRGTQTYTGNTFVNAENCC